jgi:hypothetical protein
VTKATQAEWEAFQKRVAGNEGFRERYYNGKLRVGDAARVQASRGEDIEAASSLLACRGVNRYELSEAARVEVRKYRPADNPRFWTGKPADSNAYAALMNLEKTTPIFVDGYRYQQHFTAGAYTYRGFPTRARGGVAGRIGDGWVPPEMFPVRWDRGVPWIFSERVATSPNIGFDVEIETGPGKGFFYCYKSIFPWAGLYEIVPDIRSRTGQTRVDGQVVQTPVTNGWDSPPRIFFETDRYMYRMGQWNAWP